MLGGGPDIDARTVGELVPSAETAARAQAELQRLGFSVDASGLTLTITGSPELFQRVFGVAAEISQEPRGPRVRTRGQVTVPESLSEVVETVVFPGTEPYEFHP